MQPDCECFFQPPRRQGRSLLRATPRGHIRGRRLLSLVPRLSLCIPRSLLCTGSAHRTIICSLDVLRCGYDSRARGERQQRHVGSVSQGRGGEGGGGGCFQLKSEQRAGRGGRDLGGGGGGVQSTARGPLRRHMFSRVDIGVVPGWRGTRETQRLSERVPFCPTF